MASIPGDNLNNDLDGTSDNDTITGLGGDDTLDGLGGDDLIEGGFDSDSITGGDGADTLWGNSETNVVAGDGDDTLYGGSGTDQIIGGSGADVICGGSDSDTLFGGDGDDIFYFGYDQDELVGDVYFGGNGRDTLRVEGNNNFRNLRLAATSSASIEVIDFNGNTIEGTAQGDVFDISGVITFINQGGIYLLEGADRFIGSAILGDLVHGGDGNDMLFGNGGNDTLRGDGGDDTLYGGTGADYLFGGDGDDTFFFPHPHAERAGDIYDGGAGRDTLQIQGDNGFRNLTLTAAASVEVIDFGDGRIDGTDQGDTFDISGVTTFVNYGSISLLEGADRFLGSATLGDLVYGGDGNDTLRGDGGNDTLNGGAGADYLSGGDGDDIFFYARDQDEPVGDVYFGGTGTDTLRIDSGNSFRNLTLTAAASVEVIDFGYNTMEGTAQGDMFDIGGVTEFISQRSINLLAGADSFTGSATLIDVVYGGDGADTLSGGGGDDTLRGDAGADRLDGGTGYNQLDGGTGNDTYVVRGASDLITGEIGFAEGGGIDTVEIWVDNYVLPSNLELIRLQGRGNFTATGNDAPGTLVGNSGHNTLYGRGGNDQINGNAGADTLVGGVGTDTLVGGAGADHFVFTAVAESRATPAERDVINGFDHGQDRIDLSAIDANAFVLGNQTFRFIGSAAFSAHGATSAGELRFQSFGGNWNIVSLDRNGDGVADMQIFVNLTSSMAMGDFIL